MISARKLRCAALLLLAASLSGPAAATDPDALIRQGVVLRQQGKDAEALEVFKQAYALQASPKALAQIGLAEQALGNWVEAEPRLAEALDAKDDAWIKSNKKALEGALKTVRDRLGRLELVGNVEGAQLKINGKPAGKLPLSQPVRVVAGTVVVEVEAPGYWPLSTNVIVQPGRMSREVIALVARPSEPVLTRTTASKPPAGPVAVSEPPPPRASGSNLKTLGWVASGAGVVGAAVGVIGLVLRKSAADRYNDDGRCLIGGLSREENCHADRAAADTAGTIAVAGFIGGGAFLASALGLFLAAPEEPPSKLACAPGLSPLSGLSVSCAARF